MEPILLWGIGQATVSIFKPVLEDLAKDLAQDAAKSYVGQAFASVFSVINKKPLTKATGLALQEFLRLMEDELLDAEVAKDKIANMQDAVKYFLQNQSVQHAIAELFLTPDYHLDPKIFAVAWQALPLPPALPDEFDWARIAKRFARKVREIRDADAELRDTFTALQQRDNAEALKELVGLPPEFDLDTYREALVERFGNLSLDSMDTSGGYYAVQLWSVFVPQSVRGCQTFHPQWLELPKEHQQRLLAQGELDAAELAELEKLQAEQRSAFFEQPLQPVMDLLKFLDAPTQANTPASEATRVVILGDPGAGKSALLRFLALQWARLENANQRYSVPLPLLIELRDYNRWACASGKSFPRYLHEASTWHRLNQHTLDYLLKQDRRVVLLLDGLDEVFDPTERDQVMNDIQRFSNDYKQTPIIVTSRVVGYRAQRLRDAAFQDVMLQDLDNTQISDFLARWHSVVFSDKSDGEHKRARLAKAIGNAKSIKLLAGNPLLLTMMAIINRYQELPRDRVMLYEKAAEVLLQQWDTERGLGDFPEVSKEIDLRAKNAILRRIAYAMQTGKADGQAANIIHGDSLIDLVEGYLCDELHFPQARAAANALVQQLRARNFILCFVGANSYAFVHRTFLEYFCAAELVHRFHVAKSLNFNDLQALFERHYRDDDWREVLRLICGQIDEGFVGQLVEFLATRTDLAAWDGDSTLPELALAFWCLGEAKTLSKLSASGELLWQRLVSVCEQGLSYVSFVELLPAVEELGTRLPGKHEIPAVLAWRRDLTAGQGYWASFLAAVFADRRQIQALLTSALPNIRAGALYALAQHWQDADTRHLLTERAVQDEHENCRSTALAALAKTWQDDDTRRLLTERAVQDDHWYCRSTALKELAKTWQDADTRRLLTERAVQDESYDCRSTALEVLAKTWQDDETYRLLTERAVQDGSYRCRSTALYALANTWQDADTRRLLTERAPVEGVAAALLGQAHSRFGEILFTKDLDGGYPYLDPRQAIPRKHIERAAEKAGLAAAQIDETVRTLSAHLGWDITLGSGAAA